VHDRLEPQHAFAFCVRLAGQPPEVQLEHGQVVARCLDRGFDHRGGSAGAAGTLSGAEHGAYFGHVQPGAGPVHHRVEDLLHAVSVGEDQVAARLSQVCQRWIYSACLCFALDLDEQQRSGFAYGFAVYQLEYNQPVDA
jgi:hypothetical protein